MGYTLATIDCKQKGRFVAQKKCAIALRYFTTNRPSLRARPDYVQIKWKLTKKLPETTVYGYWFFNNGYWFFNKNNKFDQMKIRGARSLRSRILVTSTWFYISVGTFGGLAPPPPPIPKGWLRYWTVPLMDMSKVLFRRFQLLRNAFMLQFHFHLTFSTPLHCSCRYFKPA